MKLPTLDVAIYLAVANFFVVAAFCHQAMELDEVRAERDDAQRRMGQCIDIAADAREFALMSEAAWLKAAEDAAHCQMSEGWMYNICPGPEYWTSYGWGGP